MKLMLDFVPNHMAPEGFLAFWQGPGDERLLVAVNLAPNQSRCCVRLPYADLGEGQWQLEDLIGDVAHAVPAAAC